MFLDFRFFLHSSRDSARRGSELPKSFSQKITPKTFFNRKSKNTILLVSSRRIEWCFYFFSSSIFNWTTSEKRNRKKSSWCTPFAFFFLPYTPMYFFDFFDFSIHLHRHLIQIALVQRWIVRFSCKRDNIIFTPFDREFDSLYIFKKNISMFYRKNKTIFNLLYEFVGAKSKKQKSILDDKMLKSVKRIEFSIERWKN